MKTKSACELWQRTQYRYEHELMKPVFVQFVSIYFDGKGYRGEYRGQNVWVQLEWNWHPRPWTIEIFNNVDSIKSIPVFRLGINDIDSIHVGTQQIYERDTFTYPALLINCPIIHHDTVWRHGS